MVVGAEWADRVSPYAGSRVVSDPEETRCWVCDEPTTSCTDAALHARIMAAKASQARESGRIVMARAQAQTPARTVPPRVTRDAHPGVSQDQGSQTPAEGGQTNVAPPTTVVSEAAKAPITSGSHNMAQGEGEVIQLSPIMTDTGAQTTAQGPVTIPVGDPSEYRDVLDEEAPEGKIDARIDPQRPRREGIQGVLISREDQWAQTGAWTSDPSNSRMVILTRDVHKVEYHWNTKTPTYKLFRRRFSRMPKPR